MNAQEYERKETARLDEMFDDIYDDADAEYDIAKRKYEEQFATAFRARLTQSKREWQGLTDEEVLDAWLTHRDTSEATDGFARAIEAKLKEKNS